MRPACGDLPAQGGPSHRPPVRSGRAGSAEAKGRGVRQSGGLANGLTRCPRARPCLGLRCPRCFPSGRRGRPARASIRVLARGSWVTAGGGGREGRAVFADGGGGRRTCLRTRGGYGGGTAHAVPSPFSFPWTPGVDERGGVLRIGRRRPAGRGGRASRMPWVATAWVGDGRRVARPVPTPSASRPVPRTWGRGHSSHSSPRPSPPLQSNMGGGSPAPERCQLAGAVFCCGVTGYGPH